MGEGSINHKNVRVPIEVALLHKSRHVKGVIKLLEYTELPDCFVIIMERKVNSIKDDCKDLYDFITDQHCANGCVNEELAKKIFKQVISNLLILEPAISCLKKNPTTPPMVQEFMLLQNGSSIKVTQHLALMFGV